MPWFSTTESPDGEKGPLRVFGCAQKLGAIKKIQVISAQIGVERSMVDFAICRQTVFTRSPSCE
jgi:hypothetical protein